MPRAAPDAGPAPRPPGDHTEHFDALDRLSRILDGLPWLVAGGLAIPLTIGRFYRAHGDIDIVCPLARLRQIDDAMRGAGYRLTTGVRYDIGRRRVETRIPLRAGGLLIRLRKRRLRFNSRVPQRNRLLDTITVMPYREGVDWIEACNTRRRVRREAPIEGCRVSLPGGRDVGCLNLHYARALMSFRHTLVHRMDLAVLERALDHGDAAAGDRSLTTASASAATASVTASAPSAMAP